MPEEIDPRVSWTIISSPLWGSNDLLREGRVQASVCTRELPRNDGFQNYGTGFPPDIGECAETDNEST